LPLPAQIDPLSSLTRPGAGDVHLCEQVTLNEDERIAVMSLVVNKLKEVKGLLAKVSSIGRIAALSHFSA
jgi:hypothetical protein